MVDAPAPIPGAIQRDQRAGTGYAMVLGGAVLFAVNGTVSKVALTGSELTAVDYTQIRTAGAFLVLALALAVFARDKLRIGLRDIPFYAFYGMFSFALVQWLYLVAIEHLPIGIALLIEFTGIVLVALWARVVMRANVRPRVWAALSLTLVGLALVSELWLGWTLDTVGVVAAVGGAIVLAIYLLAGERAVETRDPLTVLCFSLLFAAIVWSVVQPWWTYPFGELDRGDLAPRQPRPPVRAGLDARALDDRPRHDRAVRADDRRAPAPGGDQGRDRDDVRAGRGVGRRLGLARRDALCGADPRRSGRAHGHPPRPDVTLTYPCPRW